MNVETQGRVWRVANALLRPAGAALAGAVVAGFAGAVGARIVMRFVALASDPCRGLVTENGNACGVFTNEGTGGLIIFGTLTSAIPGAVLYFAYGPWVRGLGRWRGLAFAALALAIGGRAILDPDNPDFHRLGSPLLDVALFVLLFPLFGMIVAAVADAIERRMPVMRRDSRVSLATLPLFALMALAVLFVVMVTVGTFGLALFGVAVVVGIRASHAWADRDAARRAVAYLAAWGPVAAAAVLTTMAIARIVR